MVPYAALLCLKRTTTRYIAPPSPRQEPREGYYGSDSDDDASDAHSDHANDDANDATDIDGYAVEVFLDDGYLSTRLGRVTIEDADEVEAAGDDDLHPGPDAAAPTPSSTPKIKLLDGWRPLRDAVLLSMHSLDSPPTRRVCPGLHPVDDGPPVKCTTPSDVQVQGLFRFAEVWALSCRSPCVCTVSHRGGTFLTLGLAILVLNFLQRWNGKFWERSSLQSIGGTIYLGHEGSPCETPALQLRKMNILHTNGFHECNVVACGCIDGEESQLYRQLLRAGCSPQLAHHLEPR